MNFKWRQKARLCLGDRDLWLVFVPCFLLLSPACKPNPTQLSHVRVSHLSKNIRNSAIAERVIETCGEEFVNFRFNPDHFLAAINSNSLRDSYFLPLYFALYDIDWIEEEIRKSFLEMFPVLKENNIYFFNNVVNGTYALLVIFPDKVLLHFRGSSARSPQSFITDLIALNIPIVDEHQNSGFLAHAGFYNSSRNLLSPILDVYRSKLSASEMSLPIHVSGHSLGGALATLVGYQLSKLEFRVASIHTSGQPKFANYAFASHIAEWFKLKSISYRRLFHRQDVVSLIGDSAAYSNFSAKIYNMYKKHIAESFFNFVHLDSGIIFEEGFFQANTESLNKLEVDFWRNDFDLSVFSLHSAENYFCRLLRHLNVGHGGFG